MKKNVTFFISLLLVMMIALGAATPASAAYSAQKGSYFVASQSNGAQTSATISEGASAVTKENGGLTVQKTIAETGVENVFDVTLDVRTQMQISTVSITPTAAVVLVFDASASMMEDDDKNGKTRMQEAREAAQAFLESYCNVPSGVRRMVSVVAFWKDAHIVQDWIDLGDPRNRTMQNGFYTFLNDSRITSGVSTHSGTNIDGGMLLAENLIKEESSGGSAVLAGITNRHVVLLSDGASNANVVSGDDIQEYVRFYYNTSAPVQYYANSQGIDPMGDASTAKTWYSEPGNTNQNWATIKLDYLDTNLSSLVDEDDVIYGMFDNANYHFHHKDPVTTAERIRQYEGPNHDVNVQLHSIYCGNPKEKLTNTADAHLTGSDPNIPLYRQRAAAIKADMESYNCIYCDAAVYDLNNNTQSANNEVPTYLRNISDSYATTANLSQMNSAFNAIQQSITLDVSAWQATDMLGDGYQFMSFVGDYNENEVSLYPQRDGLSWDLKNATDLDSSSAGHYRMTYRVKLDTFDADFAANEMYPSNDWANLRYYLIEDGVPTPTRSVFFNHPSALGFKGDLSFTKVDQYGNGIANAKFQLVSKETNTQGNALWTSAEATSDANGVVSITDIPSGHSYTLVETVVPDGYKVYGDVYDVEVSYGVVTLRRNGVVVADNRVINTSETEYTTLQLDKTVVNGDSSKPFSFTVKLFAPDGTQLTQPLHVRKAGSQPTTVPYDSASLGYRVSLKHGETILLGTVSLNGTPVLEMGSRYEVTEDDYTAEGYVATGGAVRSGTIDTKTGVTLAYTNTLYKRLTIQKILAGSAANPNNTFNFHFRLLDAQGRVISGVPLAVTSKETGLVYTSVIEQTGERAGWYSVSMQTLPSGSGTLEISGIPGNCARVLLHERDLGFGYTASYADADGNTLSPDVLIADSYPVSYAGVLTAGYQVTNTRESGSLEISKKVTSIVASELNETFEFTITLTNLSSFTGTLQGYRSGSLTPTPISFTNGKAEVTLGNGQSMRIEGLVAGTEYTVTESVKDGFETTVIQTVGTTTSTVNGTTASGSIVAGQPTKLQYENASTAGGLIVEKKLISDYAPDAGKLFTFVVTIHNNAIDLSGTHTFGEMTFVNGRAVFELGNNGRKVATGLPPAPVIPWSRACTTRPLAAQVPTRANLKWHIPARRRALSKPTCKSMCW